MKCKCNLRETVKGSRYCYTCLCGRSESSNYCLIQNCILPNLNGQSCKHHREKWLLYKGSDTESYLKWISEAT